MFALVLAAAIALAGGCAGRAPAPEPAPAMAGSEVAAVRGTLEQWRQAYEVRSVEALARLYAAGDDVVVVVEGAATRGASAVTAALTERLGRAKDVRVRFREVAVTRLGEAGASVWARMSREVSDGVTTVAEEGVVTLALRRDGAAWKIVAEHFSYTR
ncbi:MAG: nuclear transport factor 2 family protein [Kofleriaceae bacterium]